MDAVAANKHLWSNEPDRFREGAQRYRLTRDLAYKYPSTADNAESRSRSLCAE